MSEPRRRKARLPWAKIGYSLSGSGAAVAKEQVFGESCAAQGQDAICHGHTGYHEPSVGAAIHQTVRHPTLRSLVDLRCEATRFFAPLAISIASTDDFAPGRRSVTSFFRRRQQLPRHPQNARRAITNAEDAARASRR